MPEEPEEILPEEDVTPSAGLKKCVPTRRSRVANRLVIMTTAMAKMTRCCWRIPVRSFLSAHCIYKKSTV